MADSNDLYQSIEQTPAGELLKLSAKELDALIAQAREAKERASRIIDWLQAIQLEKAVRDNVNQASAGDVS